MSDILHNPCKEMWENAKDFKQLQNAMVEYLEGRCPNNPWMVDKIDDETIPILNSLVKINRYGFVTIQGQPGVNKTQDSGSMVCQRAYMDGFMLKKNSTTFINDLVSRGGLVVVKTRLDPIQQKNGKYKNILKYPPKVYGEFKHIIQGKDVKRRKTGNIIRGTGKYINLTKEIFLKTDPVLQDKDIRKGLKKEGDKLVRYYTNRRIEYSGNETKNLSPILMKYLNKNAYQLCVINTEYGKNNLDSIILEALLKIS